MSKLDDLYAAGQVAAQAHQQIAQAIRPGINLLQLEAIAADTIRKADMKPAFLGYKGYPAVTCLSVNDEIVHGIPHDYQLQNGDTIAVDLGVKYNDWIVDTAQTHPVGIIDHQTKALLAASKEALNLAIEQCQVGNKTGDIGSVIEEHIRHAGFYIVRDLSGHGVGHTLQEEPSIPNYGRPDTGAELRKGMAIAVEPIASAIKTKIAILSDGWTIIAQTPCQTAHFEDTIYLSEEGPVVVTRLGERNSHAVLTN